MDDAPKKRDWSTVNQMLDKREPLPVHADTSVVPDVTTPKADAVQGLVQQMKAGAVQRRAALDQMKALTKSQLEVFTHQLQNAARVKKVESTVLTEQFLQKLDHDYNEILSQLRLRNEAFRRDTLKKLGDETAKDLEEIATKDWPDWMIKKSLEMVETRYNKFLDKLFEDANGT